MAALRWSSDTSQASAAATARRCRRRSFRCGSPWQEFTTERDVKIRRAGVRHWSILICGFCSYVSSCSDRLFLALFSHNLCGLQHRSVGKRWNMCPAMGVSVGTRYEQPIKKPPPPSKAYVQAHKHNYSLPRKETDRGTPTGGENPNGVCVLVVHLRLQLDQAGHPTPCRCHLDHRVISNLQDLLVAIGKPFEHGSWVALTPTKVSERRTPGADTQLRKSAEGYPYTSCYYFGCNR